MYGIYRRQVRRQETRLGFTRLFGVGGDLYADDLVRVVNGAATWRAPLQFADKLHAFSNLTPGCVLTVQPFRACEDNEELR